MTISFTNICSHCTKRQHCYCDGQVKCGDCTKSCNCECRLKRRTFYSSPFLVLSFAGCISAVSIKDRLNDLYKDTDISIGIRNHNQCNSITKPDVCGHADLCLSRTLFAASSCKKANDSAARKDNPIVQYHSDKACKSDLELAEESCKLMKDSNELYKDNRDGSQIGLSGLCRNSCYASSR